jgi:Ca-activated chloride channel family protein
MAFATFLEHVFQHAGLLWLLGLLPALVLLTVTSRRQRARAVGVWAGLAGGTPGGWPGPALRLAALGLLVIGSAGPLWGREARVPPARGRDLVVALDVSQSMLAEDHAGRSRLARARAALDRLIDLIQRRGGHRVGLILFAGQARTVCPLTDDYDHVRYLLAEAHPGRFGPRERLGPGEGGPIGTSLQAALEAAVAAHDPEAAGFQDTLLVTDGDDLSGHWSAAARGARAAGVPVHALGLGDPAEPSLIPTGQPEEPFLVEELPDGTRRKVETCRHDEVLTGVAGATGGAAVFEEGGADVLVRWFQDHVAGRPVRERWEDQRPVPVHQFAWFFAAGLALVLAELVAGEGVRRPCLTGK